MINTNTDKYFSTLDENGKPVRRLKLSSRNAGVAHTAHYAQHQLLLQASIHEGKMVIRLNASYNKALWDKTDTRVIKSMAVLDKAKAAHVAAYEAWCVTSKAAQIEYDAELALLNQLVFTTRTNWKIKSRFHAVLNIGRKS